MTSNIVFGIDDKYVPHVAACINSLLEHNSARSFHFFILSLDISLDRRNLLQRWIDSQKHKVTFINIDNSITKLFPIKLNDYISPASYLRLLIPQLLPSTISKVLYVDGDVIFKGSISELLNMDISNYAAAAVEDAPNNGPSRLGYDEKYSYFNAGILLLNLDYLRSIDFTRKAFDYIMINAYKITSHDQDVMNALLFGKVLYLPIIWNMLDCYYIRPFQIANIYKKDIKQYKKKALVIHFSGRLKPWHYGCRHPLKKMYKAQIKKLPFHIPIDRWEGVKKYPPQQRCIVLFGYPWVFFVYVNKILREILRIIRFRK